MRRLLADTRPLQNAHFRRLWLANIVTVVGAQLTVVAVPAQIYLITGSSAYVGLSGLFGLVPLVVFGLWGGALADHFDRRTILIVTTVGLIATSAGFWAQAALGLDNVWLLLSLFAVQQGFLGANQPARSAILPRLLPIEQLPSANALNMTLLMAGGIAGPLVGGALIPVLGFSWLYFVDTLSLLTTLYAVLLLPRFPIAGPGQTPGLRSVIAGFGYLRTQPILMMSFVVDLIAMVFGMPRALFPELANQQFGGPAAGGLAFALLFAAIPAGAVIGGVLSGWVSRIKRQGLAVVVSVLVWGVAVTGFGVAAWLAGPGSFTALWLGVAVLMLVIGGAADMTSATFRSSILLGSATDEMRGRLQGLFVVVVVGGPRIGDVAHGGAAAVVGAPAAAASGGILVVLLTIAAVMAVPGFVRHRLD